MSNNKHIPLKIEGGKNTFFSSKHTLNCSGKIIDLSAPIVMGILNITSDSFHDGGKYLTEKEWLSQTEKMLSEGASIIDVGAVSTRPGSVHISQQNEIEKLLPVITSIRKRFPEIIISIDTFRSEAAMIAVDNGADIINDIYAGSFDENMFTTIAGLKVPYIIMHMQGTPLDMQQNPVYENIIKEITIFFSEKINKLKMLGINDIIIDPGIGFGKSVEHNFEILDKLEMLKIFELPVLIGVSRKISYK